MDEFAICLMTVSSFIDMTDWRHSHRLTGKKSLEKSSFQLSCWNINVKVGFWQSLANIPTPRTP